MAKSRILIGVTSDGLLKKKKFAQFLQPFETRCKNVRLFLQRQHGNQFKIDLFEINDPVGLAGTDTGISSCVLTQEVAKGGDMINAQRKENGLEPVELVFVDMVKVEETETDAKFSNKMSSTLIRERLLEKENE